MKRRISIFTLMLVCMFFVACNTVDAVDAKTNQMGNKGNSIVKDSIMALHIVSRYVIGKDKLFNMESEFPIDIYSYKQKLFLLNYSYPQLVILDIDNNESTTNTLINDVISEGSRQHFGVKQVVVTDDYIFIGFLRAVYCVTKEGVVVNKLLHDENIDFFTITDNESIVVFFSDHVKSYDYEGNELGVCELTSKLTGHYSKVGNIVYIADGDLVYAYSLSNNELIKVVVPINRGTSDELYFSFGFGNYTVWYPYYRRDKVVLLDMVNNEFEEVVKFSNNNFAPTDEEIQLEEGVPNFRLVVDNDGGVYIVVMTNNVLSVYKSDLLFPAQMVHE